MNICNVTSNNFNLDCNGKDMQIEVYEQLIKQLQQENKILKENAEHNDKVVELLKEENEHLRIQISARENVCDRLAGNWNLLKRYCYEAGNDENTKLNGLNVLDKMQEMEKNYGNVEDNT